MSAQAKVEFLSKRTERPIYYASSAGRNARHEIDQPMNIVSVEVADARQRNDTDERDEFQENAPAVSDGFYLVPKVIE